MKTRPHHKVDRGSIYYDKEADAPWPVKAYFIRLALFTVELVLLASWCLIIPLIDAKYVSGWGSLWAKTQPLVAIIGFGFVSGALVLSINPLAIPLSSFKNLLAWASPPGLVWKIWRAGLRLFKPTAPCFFERFLHLLMIGVSAISWNFVPYLIRPWIAFSRDRLDRLVVYETIAIAPAAYLINRCLDRWKRTKKSPYGVSQFLLTLHNFTSPAVLFYHLAFRPIVLLACRLRYGHPHEPYWL
jgi:hypothetical protein